jgi:hypothetical protein
MKKMAKKAFIAFTSEPDNPEKVIFVLLKN